MHKLVPQNYTLVFCYENKQVAKYINKLKSTKNPDLEQGETLMWDV